MTKAYNNPYYPLPIKWIRVIDDIDGYNDVNFSGSWGTEDYVWYPAKLFAAKYKISSEDKIVAYDHIEGYPRPITWREYKTMFAKLEYND